FGAQLNLPSLSWTLCSCSHDPFINPSSFSAVDTGRSSTPSSVYPTVSFQVLNVDHVFLRQDSPEPSGNGSLKAQSFLITGLGAGLLQPAVNASYGPLAVDASISPDLLLSGRRILPVILGRQVRSSSPAVKILFHMPSESNITAGQDTEGSRGDNRKNVGAKAKDGAHCVTAYAFWETREVRGACLVPPGGFCVAQLKPEPNWFSSASRSGSSSREAERTEGLKGLQGNVVEVYFQSRRDPTGQCTPQDSLQRVGVGRRRESGGSGTPMRRIGSVSLHKTPPGNPTFLRLRLGGAVVIQTSSKPLKTTDVATFYVFLASTSTLESFTLRGLLEVLQLDFVPKEVSEQAESHTISWRLELPGNVKDVGIMRIHTTQKDYVGLAPLVMNTDVLNTAVLTGKMVLVPVKTLAVEANGSVTDVTNYTSCRSTEEDVLKVSERCNYVYVNGKETRGKSKVMLNFTYGFLSAQLEMSVWMPRLPLFVDVDDPELSQIKGWRVPLFCLLLHIDSHFSLSVGQVDVTNLVRYNLNVADPDVAWVQDGVVVMYLLQVLSPLTSAVLAERSIRVVDDKVSVTEVGVQLVSGLSLSLRLSPESNRAIVATATTRERIMQLKQEAVVSCWVQFSDGAVTPLDMFDRSVYSLTVSTPDERVATVRRTPQSTFVVAQGEGEGKGALVRVELRICEECQKSKRKSKLAVGMGTVRETTVTETTTSTTFSPNTKRRTAIPIATTVGVFSRGEGQKRSYGNMLDIPNSPLNKDIPKAEVTPKKQPPKSKTPKVIESDLIKTFRAMSDLEIGMYTLVGVSCVAILAFFINCASYNLCFRKQKTPIQTGPIPSADPKDHKHDWVWLGGSNRGAPSRHSIDSMATRGLESTLPTVSAPAIPERTATLGRSRTSSQQQHFQAKAIDPMANRSATLLARPHRSDPLHSPTSKRNQVQFTTFTTLDIKHLAALKKNGVDLNWANQQKQQHEAPAESQAPLPDMPWPVVKPLGEPQ
uniref:Si:dkey-1d7.3 n=1 Tax=Amphiprion percula TaxID=161767 RepID=A0A3P8S4P6_AMPPE